MEINSFKVRLRSNKTGSMCGLSTNNYYVLCQHLFFAVDPIVFNVVQDHCRSSINTCELIECRKQGLLFGRKITHKGVRLEELHVVSLNKAKPNKVCWIPIFQSISINILFSHCNRHRQKVEKEKALRNNRILGSTNKLLPIT